MYYCHPCFDPPDKSNVIFLEDAPPGLPYFESVYNEMDRLAKKYSFITLSEFGKSIMGKPLLYMCAGTGQRKVFYSASHHANEWMTTLVLLKFMNELFESFCIDGQIGGFSAKKLLDNTTLFFAPLINPDGVDLVLGKLSSGTFFEQAKRIAGNYPAIPFPSGWKSNIEGIDLNLQYPANWDKAKQIKYGLGFKIPAPRDYVGPAPLSAPESRALANFTRNTEPDTVLALHTQGKEIYWKFTNFEPIGAYELGHKLAEVSGYELSTPPPESDNAGYKDWFIQDFDRPGYTIEMGFGESPLPLSQFNAIYSSAAPLLATAANG